MGERDTGPFGEGPSARLERETPPSTPAGRDDTKADELNALEYRISQLETRPVPGPWYTQAPVIISALSLLVSSSTFALTQLKDRWTSQAARHSSLAQALTTFQSAKAGCQKTAATLTDDGERTAFALTCGSNLFVQSGQLEQIADSLELEDLTCDELIALGDVWLDVTKYPKALEYFTEAERPKRCDWIHNGAALREIGRTYYAPGAARDLAKGRAYFQRAVGVFTGPDFISRFQLAYTLEMWGISEAAFGTATIAREKLEAAQTLYADPALEHDAEAKNARYRVVAALARLPQPQPVASP